MDLSTSSSSLQRPVLGLSMAFVGALIITPDTLLIRLSGLEGWGLTFWRGLLIGISLFVIWAVMESRQLAAQFRRLFSLPAMLIVAANLLNNLAFNFATMETSITVVVTALATAPVLAAGLGFVILREPTALRTWVTIAATMLGVFIVILNGEGAMQAPSGNVWLGGFLGFLSALGIAFIFTLTRKYPQTPILLACAIGTLLSGLYGLIGAPAGTLLTGNAVPILLMGLFVMPVSWALLSLAPRHTSSTNVSLFLLLEMVLGPFWVWIGVGEQPSLPMILGAALVLVSLVLYFLATARETRRQAALPGL